MRNRVKMRLPKKEERKLRTAHIKLWNWIYKQNIKGKIADKTCWPGWIYNGGKYLHVSLDCFACKAADLIKLDTVRQSVNGSNCPYCPIKKDAGICYETRSNAFGLWARYCDSNPKKAAKYALKIRNAWRDV